MSTPHTTGKVKFLLEPTLILIHSAMKIHRFYLAKKSSEKLFIPSTGTATKFMPMLSVYIQIMYSVPYVKTLPTAQLFEKFCVNIKMCGIATLMSL